MSGPATQICAVLVAADPEGLFVLTLGGRQLSLPGTPFDPQKGQGFEACLRDWASIHTAAKITKVMQAGASVRDGGIRICLLALVADRNAFMPRGAHWTPLAHIFPWEMRLEGEPPALARVLRPALASWAGAADKARRRQSLAQLFGDGQHDWQPQWAGARYDLLYEAALVPEALRDRSGGAISVRARHAEVYGQVMAGDDRAILAGALSLLREKLAHTALMCALSPHPFTLGSMQKTVQAVIGQPLHTQNFRRDLMRSGLIVATGEHGRIGRTRAAKLWQWADGAARSLQGMPLPLKAASG